MGSDLEFDARGYAKAKRRVFDPRRLDDDDNAYMAESELVDYLSKHNVTYNLSWIERATNGSPKMSTSFQHTRGGNPQMGLLYCVR